MTTTDMRLKVISSPCTTFQMLPLLVLLLLLSVLTDAKVDEKKDVEAEAEVAVAVVAVEGGTRKEENMFVLDGMTCNVQLCVIGVDSNKTPSVNPFVMLPEETEAEAEAEVRADAEVETEGIFPDKVEGREEGIKSIPFSLPLITLKLSFPIKTDRERKFLP